MSAEEEVNAAVAAAVERFGPPFGLVVSAGVFEHQVLAEATLEFWNRTIGINLTGTFLAVKAAAPYMRAAGAGGSIIIYTSTAGQSGGGGGGFAYATSKGAQIIFMKCMAYELAGDKIRVNCIAPAWTETDMAAASLDCAGSGAGGREFPAGPYWSGQRHCRCHLLSSERLSRVYHGDDHDGRRRPRHARLNW